MDRCELAFQYRKERYNCAQAVAAAFADLLETTPEALFAAPSEVVNCVASSPAGALEGA